MLLPISALGDPALKQSDLGGSQGRAMLGHQLVGVLALEMAQHGRLIGFARHDGRLAGLAEPERLIPIDEGNAAGLLDAAVAGAAMFHQDRADIAVELHRFISRNNGHTGK